MSPTKVSMHSHVRSTSKLPTSVPPLALTPCRQLPRAPVTTQIQNKKPEITGPPALLTCGGMSLQGVDCSKPLPPLPPRKLFFQSPALKKIFKSEKSKPTSGWSGQEVGPFKPVKYTNAWGSPIQNVPSAKKGRRTPSKGITTGSKCSLKKIFKKTHSPKINGDDSFLDLS